MAKITKQRTSSIVTEPQEEIKGNYVNPTHWPNCAGPFDFYWSNLADGLEQMLVIRAHVGTGKRDSSISWIKKNYSLQTGSINVI